MKARNDTLPAWKASAWSPSPATPLMTDWELVKLMLESGGRQRKTAGGPQGGPLQDDDLDDWLSSPIDDYCSELLSDFSATDTAGPPSAAASGDAASNPLGPETGPSKPVINFSIFSRPLMEPSPCAFPPPSEKDGLPEKRVCGGEEKRCTEKISEAPIASSSLCSNNDPKRRRRKEEDSVDDLTEENGEGESTSTRSAGKGRLLTKKRSRSAEIHNLSERRRRDRINEKMRALQELVPCCNKQVDKASMLDEVIEYLKSLQMQVQAMSMGYMRPMMLPNGMPMNMNMNMNMNMGMGMGMVDMGGFPLMSYPQMNGLPHGVPMMMPGRVMPMTMLQPPQFVPMRPSTTTPPPPPPPPPSPPSKVMPASEQ